MIRTVIRWGVALIIALIVAFLLQAGVLQKLFTDISAQIKNQGQVAQVNTTVQSEVTQLLEKTTGKDPGTAVKADRALMAGFINETRKKGGISAIQEAVLLDEIAQEWVSKTHQQQKLDFTHQDLNTISSEIQSRGFRYVTVAVNLASGLKASGVIVDLMKTKTNRDIVTNKVYTHYGIGVLPSLHYGKIWLLIFAEKISDIITVVPADEATMLKLVNQERIKYHLGLLKLNSRLVKAARMKARDIADKDYFDHISPVYGSPFEMMTKLGIKFRMAAENLAGHQTVEQAHIGLMNSPGHRKNILTPEFTDIGIGVVNGSKYGKVFTQLFILK